MKRVLFIGITEYDLENSNSHLQKKFEGLSTGMNVFVIARSKNGLIHRKTIWNSEFYLIGNRLIFLPLAFFAGIYICFFKKIDTIVCQGPLTEGFIGTILKVLWRKELIVEIHGDWREGPFINKQRLFAPLLRRVTPYIASISFRSADKIRSVAEYFLSELRSKYPNKKYFVFPTYSDLNIFLNEKNIEFKKYILTVAVLSPIKNIEILIEAFVQIHIKFPEFRLMIVGSGPSLESLKHKAKSAKLDRSVIFAGKMSQQEVKDVMKDCYVFVLPSLSEGLPRVLLEAMALSKPVIASRVGGIPEIVKDGVNGFLIEPKDEMVLIDRLVMLLENESLARKLGKEGRKFVESNFSNKKYVQNYIDMVN